MANRRARIGGGASLIFALFALWGCLNTGYHRTGPPPPPVSADNPLTVMSFNIRMGLGQEPGKDIYNMNWGQELDGVIAAIRSVDPDIVGLQEVAGHSQIYRIAKALNMNYAFEWHGSKFSESPWWGVGILSKYKIKSARGSHISLAPSKNIVIATVDAGGRDLMFVSVHKDHRLRDGRSITNILENVENANMPVVLIGDFNIYPTDPRLERIKERFHDTAIAVDTENAKHVLERGTFGLWGRRIDYVFAEKEHFSVLDAALVPLEHHRASDHLAYYSRLTLKR